MSMIRTRLLPLLALGLSAGATTSAHAFLLQFGIGGPIAGSIRHTGGAGVNTGLLPFSFASGNATITGLYGEYIAPRNPATGTPAAFLRVTNLRITNTGGAPIDDNLYMFSDIFPATRLARTASVGATGSMSNLLGAPSLIGSQVRMSYLYQPYPRVPFPVTFNLTTPAVFFAPPAIFTQFASAVAPAGVVQLVATYRVVLPTLGDSVFLPNSINFGQDIVTSEFGGSSPDPIDTNAVAPLPNAGSLALLGGGLLGFAALRARRRGQAC